MSRYDKDNPIASIDGYAVPVPKEYGYTLQDLSDDDSGRTEDGTMHKNRNGQVVKLTLEWRRTSVLDGSEILKAVQPEYVTVEYFDSLFGVYKKAVFYRGDVTATLLNGRQGVYKKIAFNLITRNGAVFNV